MRNFWLPAILASALLAVGCGIPSLPTVLPTEVTVIATPVAPTAAPPTETLESYPIYERPETNWIYAARQVSTDGLNEFWRAEDISLNGYSSAVTVYTSAQRGSDGEFMFDDGNTWAVLVEKGGDVFPLFPREYVQLGGVRAAALTDADGAARVILTVRQSASYTVLDCAYDASKDAFRISETLKLENINLYGESE
ncbi:MAG: hypothetical protein LBK41_02765 [Clostridiales bacterium]|jgi:hypothetical protein|nr:hypothetical protein [Clostridiales bacterium]